MAEKKQEIFIKLENITSEIDEDSYFKSLNDSNRKEILMDDVFYNIKKKKLFKSSILKKDDQKFLFQNIKKIDIFKGKTKISDIAFIQKK